MKIIGAAEDFWRLRLTRMDTTEDLDFEWHPDILYRAPVVEQAAEVEQWIVEAVHIEDYETIVSVATFGDRETAQTFFDRANDDLREMTKHQFEESYLSPQSEAPSEDSEV